MKTLARLVTRSGEQNSKVDLVLGMAMKSENTLKPNTIYEIREVMGELMVVEIGESAIGDNDL